MKTVLLVGLGGFTGSVLRYVIGNWVTKSQLLSAGLPATLVVNVLGCLLIGLLFGYAARLPKDFLLLATTGFCGGFTTFSTFSLDSLKMIERGEYMNMLIYVGLSLLVGLAATWLGYWLSQQLPDA